MCRRGAPARTGTPRRMLPVGPALYYAFPDEFSSDREVYRTNLDRTVPRHRNPSRKPDRGIQVLRLDQGVSSELFARLRERTVGDKRLCVAHPYRRRRRGRLQRVAVQVLTGSGDLPGELLVLVKNLLKRLARRLCGGIDIEKQHVLHSSSSPACDSSPSGVRAYSTWILLTSRPHDASGNLIAHSTASSLDSHSMM